MWTDMIWTLGCLPFFKTRHSLVVHFIFFFLKHHFHLAAAHYWREVFNHCAPLNSKRANLGLHSHQMWTYSEESAVYKHTSASIDPDLHWTAYIEEGSAANSISFNIKYEVCWSRVHSGQNEWREHSQFHSQSKRIIKCLCLSYHREIKPETLTETFHQKQIHSFFALYMIYA